MDKQFDKPLSPGTLNLEDKTRSNIFMWRGQFSPELIENLIEAYCPKDAVVLDPFCGSGTILCESAYYGLKATGIEVNPAAYILSRTYELINLTPDERQSLLNAFLTKVQKVFPEPGILKFNDDYQIPKDEFSESIVNLRKELSNKEILVLEAFIILLDIYKNDITPVSIYSTLYKLLNAIKQFPSSDGTISAILGDARSIPVENKSIDFVITSPPYINVFNYHQNYRESAELLGWELLKIAKSEIGSNRANRRNRFFTVVQYCLDLALTLAELHRVCKARGKLIFIVGHESRVLGVPIYNAEILSSLATESGLFSIALRQKRQFKNKFGEMIREDLLHLEKLSEVQTKRNYDDVAREVASFVLKDGINVVPDKNRTALQEAINKVSEIQSIPLYRGEEPAHYQHIDNENLLELDMPEFPTPHYNKLKACMENPYLPDLIENV